MRNSLVFATPVAAVLALAGQLMAGGFFLELGNPEASKQARQLNAALTVQVAGCHDPASAQVTAEAIGFVNGERRTIPLRVERLSKPGMFALAQQWPKEGNWVIHLVGRVDKMFTNSLIPAGPDGVDRYHAKAQYQEFTAGEVDAMLKAAGRS